SFPTTRTPQSTPSHQAEARGLMKAADQTMTDAERKRKFLDAYRELHTIKAACQATGISRSTHHYWLASDPDYAELYEYARQDVSDTLEAEAWRRGYEGVERIKYYKGKEIGREREYSDQLLLVLLKANAPEKFGEKAVLDVNMRSLMGSI